MAEANTLAPTINQPLRFSKNTHAFRDDLARRVYDCGQAPERPSPASVSPLLRQPLRLGPRGAPIDRHVDSFDLPTAPRQSITFDRDLDRMKTS